ncbi:MAG: outer membrane protein transport protein [Synergistaceae bacterium]|nr:outer membrane protein transport protein [Synergistaceae bacterium]
MKKIILLHLLLLVANLFVSTVSYAEGFGVYEWSAAGVAMGENYMFAENDPAVLAYNPSQITKLRGSYLQFGATWIDPTLGVDYLDRSGKIYNSSNNYSPVIAPSLFYAQDTKGNNFWWGVGIFPRFGNEIEHGRASLGRYDTVYSQMKGVTIQPTIAFKPHKKWSLALGLDFNYTGLRMDRAIWVPLYGGFDGGCFNLEGTSFNVGYVVSAMYDFNDKTSAAVTYRSKIRQSMDADFDVDDRPTLLGGPLHTRAHGVVTLPDSISFGIGHKLSAKTRVEADIVWTNWTTYDALNISLDDDILPGIKNVNATKNWSSSWRLGIGLEHKFSKHWALLTGYVFDESPVPDAYIDLTVPTGDRHRWSAGFKYTPNDYTTWAFAYTMIWTASRTIHGTAINPSFITATTNNGLTHAVSLSLTFKLK